MHIVGHLVGFFKTFLNWLSKKQSFVPLYFAYQPNIATLQQWADYGKIRLASDYSDKFLLH